MREIDPARTKRAKAFGLWTRARAAAFLEGLRQQIKGLG